MKIQLELHGGLYGHLLLEPIETNDEKIAFPEDLLKVIETSAFQAYEATAKGDGGLTHERGIRPQTEGENYCLTISHSAAEVNSYSIPKSILEQEPDLEKLVKFIWSVAKPVPP